MIIEFSESDILSSKLVEPAWYRVLIEDIEERASNDGASTNAWIKGKILYNADNGSKENANVPTPYLWLINSKGAFTAVGIFASLGMEPSAGKRANTDALKGREVEMFIGNTLYKGKMVNCVTDQYRPMREVQQQP